MPAMPRLRVLAPLLAALALDCGGGEADNTGFSAGPHTTSGPGSFGTGGPDTGSTAATSDPDTGAPTSTSSTTAPDATSSDPGPTTTSSTSSTSSTGEPATTGSSGDAGTTGPPLPACGDGVVQDGEFCDDGNRSDDDACLGDCTPGTAVLALVGRGTEPASAALFTPDSGWSQTPTALGVAAADLATTPTGAMAVIRRASVKIEEQDELWFARWQDSDPAPWAMFAKVGAFGFTKGSPSLAAVADTVGLAFLGTDNKHYSSLYSNDAWAAFAKIPAGNVMQQAFGPGAATLAPGAQETYAVYVGDDAKLYYSHKAGPGAVWEASVAAPPLNVLGTVSPTALVDDQDDLVVAYVRKDGKLAAIKLLTPMNAWGPEVLVHPQALTGTAIALTRADAGRYALAWRGFDTQGIYLALSTADDPAAWDDPITVELPQATSTPPALVPGVLGADLEILYTAGGKLRHARVADGTLVAPVDVAEITGATSVAATRVQLEP